MTHIEIQRRNDAVTHEEYGCDFRRILPWGQPGPSETGLGVSTVAPNGMTMPHSHADHEYFYVVRGHGRVHIDGRSADIQPGDAIAIEPHRVHHFENRSAVESLELLSVWSLGAFGVPR